MLDIIVQGEMHGATDWLPSLSVHNCRNLCDLWGKRHRHHLQGLPRRPHQRLWGNRTRAVLLPCRHLWSHLPELHSQLLLVSIGACVETHGGCYSSQGRGKQGNTLPAPRLREEYCTVVAAVPCTALQHCCYSAAWATAWLCQLVDIICS